MLYMICVWTVDVCWDEGDERSYENEPAGHYVGRRKRMRIYDWAWDENVKEGLKEDGQVGMVTVGFPPRYVSMVTCYTYICTQIVRETHYNIAISSFILKKVKFEFLGFINF